MEKGIVLILIGSLGFITWHEVLYFRRRKQNKLSLNSKLVLLAVGILIAVFAALFLILEYNNSMDGYSWWQTGYTSIFNAIAIRGSGLMSVDINTLQPATLLLLIISSFIGASPGSTGGGIKTSAFIIFLATLVTVFANTTVVVDVIFKLVTQQRDSCQNLFILVVLY